MANEDLPPIITEASDVDLQGEASAGEALYTCNNCGLPLEYSGRGRHPTQCKRGEGCKADAPRLSTNARRGAQADIDRIKENMESLYVMIGMGVSVFDQHDGLVIGSNASKLADSWATLAANDPKARKALLRFMSGSSWAGVFAAHAMVALPIAQHHGMIPMKREPNVPTP